MRGSPLVPSLTSVPPGLDLLVAAFTGGSAILVFTVLPRRAATEAVP